MKRNSPVIFESGYCLKLSNDLIWNIIPTKKTKDWVDEFAFTMGLKDSTSNNYSNIIFADSEELHSLQTENMAYKICILKSVKVWFAQKTSNIICEINCEEEKEFMVMEMFQALYPVYQHIQDRGGVPLHAGLIVRDGIGVALAASSSIGKSTCCRRIPPPWQAICDDETLIVPDNRGQYLIHPFPTWSEYLNEKNFKRTWNVDTSVPLSAIFFLEQAETDEAILIGKGQSAVFISQIAIQVYNRMWGESRYKEEKANKKGVFDNACRIAETIPAYILRVSLKGKFWDEIDNVISL